MDRDTHTVKRLDVVPQSLQQGAGLTLRGAGWGACPVHVKVDGAPRLGIHVAQGFRAPGDMIQPDGQGAFVAFVPTLGLALGKHRIEVVSSSDADGTRRSAHFTVTKVDDATECDESDREEAPFAREVDFWRRRFSKLGYVPRDILPARRRDLQSMRQLKKSGIVPYDRPVTPGCNWTPIGPGAGYDRSNPSQSVYTGKIHAIAVDPTNTSTVYAGASGGGVWKTTDSGATWAPKSDYQSSLAIGTLTIDPNNNLHIIAGTGIDPIGVLDYYGNGLLISTDGGDTWTETGSSTFNLASISRIIFDPTDFTSKHLLLSSSLGVYESNDGGMSWTQLFAAVTTDMVVIPGAGGTLKALVGVHFQGIYTSTLTAGSWSSWTQISDPSFTTGIGRVVFGQCAGTPTTIYAALEKPASPDSLGIIVRTPDGGSTWASAGKPPSSSSQTWHAFVLAVHPTDPNTVFYGEIRLWQTTTGDAPWTNVTDFLHSDQNAFAFDPVTPTTVWSGNDGGIWRSSGGGAVGTWAHANYGLATFKCIRGAHHPVWDAVFLISTQDNGTFRGDGQPAWPLIFFSDTGPVGIDPSQTLSYFTGGGYVPPEPSGRSIWRSDDAGNTFTDKTNGITGNAMFYAPFVTDPGNAGVCWFATDSLWRSADHGDTWIQVTNTLVSGVDPNSGASLALSAFALHPTDPNTVYTAGADGRVFQVQRTGATWTITNVTVTELTAPPLPTGICISSLAVDAGGYLWASVSSILYTEAIGEFSHDHVYRYDHVAGAWASRSTGLSQANPVNVIVADPSSATTLYCGADAGVFQTTDGLTWVLWDDGLPEAPVVDLLLHQPTRLLRAVTHGRSVWERPLDAVACAAVDLYLRDDLVDTGRVQPSYSAVPDPFTAGLTDYWYQSDDIKVDGPAPKYQTASPVTDFVNFEAVLQHTSPRRGVVNRFYGRVQNRGPLPANNVKLRAFFADAHAGLPLLPIDFWSSGAPFDADPSVSAWTPIGPSIRISSVAPGQPAIVEWDWTVPAAANDHSCLLLLTTCDENVLDGSGTFVVDALVPMQKMVTLKNLQVEDAVPGGMHRRPWRALSLYNTGREPALYDLVVDWATLPVNTDLYIAFEALPDPVLAATKAELKAMAGALVSRVAGSLPRTYPVRCGQARMNRRALRLRRHAGERRSLLPVLLPARRSVLLLLKPILPKTTRAGMYQFDVQQFRGKRLIGGSTYVLRVEKGA